MYYVCRLERVEVSCVYSKVKILGTLLCVVGAITMSIIQSSIIIPSKHQQLTTTTSSPPPLLTTIVLFNKEKIVGCFYLMLAVFILSSNVVLQVNLVGDRPIDRWLYLYICIMFVCIIGNGTRWITSTNVIECNNILYWSVHHCIYNATSKSQLTKRLVRSQH